MNVLTGTKQGVPVANPSANVSMGASCSLRSFHER